MAATLLLILTVLLALPRAATQAQGQGQDFQGQCSVLHARQNRGSLSAMVISTSRLLAPGHNAPVVLILVD
jgi:hypothetical protein